jgi:hypothetical protein
MWAAALVCCMYFGAPVFADTLRALHVEQVAGGTHISIFSRCRRYSRSCPPVLRSAVLTPAGLL